MKVAIYSRGLEDEIEQHLLVLLQELQEQNVACTIYQPLITLPLLTKRLAFYTPLLALPTN